MRRAISAVAVAAFATFVIGGLAAPASAVCGGGRPGEPCYCPDTKIIRINC